MSNTYQLIARQSVGSSGASSITFSNIPDNFTDLKIVVSSRTDQTASYGGNVMRIYPNGSSSGLTAIILEGSGSSASSNPYDFMSTNASDYTANTFANTEIYIPNYRSGNNKSYSSDGVTENNATAARMTLSAQLWSNTQAITSLQIIPYNLENFVENSTFSLYGISNVGTQSTNLPYASGGDVIVNDGTYWYHAFKNSGVFTPIKDLSTDILVVAGGGGAWNYEGGGGGAGGLLGFSSQALTSNTNYNCIVGAGGVGYPISGYPVNTNGNNSQFGSLTSAIGGGKGGGTGSSGGSGGGSSYNGFNPPAGGSGTAGQGNSGSAAQAGPGSQPAGGGGGAGGAGSISNGGIGATYNTTVGGSAGPYAFIDAMGAATKTGELSGGHYYYAGGGGGGLNGGSGGLGGGGTGGGYSSTAGTANTGGGGGGGGGDGTIRDGSAGGSGIIIVRYAMA